MSFFSRRAFFFSIGTEILKKFAYFEKINLSIEHSCLRVVLKRRWLMFRAFVVGGITLYLSRQSTTSSVERFDFTKRNWTEVSSMKEPRAHCAVATYQETIFVFGGLNGSKRLHSCERSVSANGKIYFVTKMNLSIFSLHKQLISVHLNQFQFLFFYQILLVLIHSIRHYFVTKKSTKFAEALCML